MRFKQLYWKAKDNHVRLKHAEQLTDNVILYIVICNTYYVVCVTDIYTL
jgi:hypothetical protein